MVVHLSSNVFQLDSLSLMKPVIIMITFITALYYILIPQSWKVMITGLIKLLTMLMHINLHSMYCKFFNYSFIDEFEAKVNRNPSHVQFISAETKQAINLQELDELANQVAHWAHEEMGFVAKDTIALVMPNRYELVAVWLGMGKIGCSSALVNINSTGKTLSHALNVSLENNSSNHDNKADKKGSNTNKKAKQSSENSSDSNKKVVIFDKEVYSKLSPEDIQTLHTDDMQIFIWEDLFSSKIKSLPTSRPNKVVRKSVTERDVLLYIFTSGTTGVSTAIRYNACMILRKKFSARSFAEDCVKFKCNVVQYIGEICRYLVAPPKEISSSSSADTKKNEKDAATSGSGEGKKVEQEKSSSSSSATAPPTPKPIPPLPYNNTELCIDYAFGNGLTSEIWIPFQQRYHIKQIVEFYLSTEGNCGLFNCFNKVGALGYIPRFVDFLYPDEIGLVVSEIDPHRADRRFDGYSDSAASNKKVLKNVLRQGDQYFNTGDLMTRDAAGYFYFSDRSGDTFRWKGENVSTAEVGAVLGGQPFINDVCVYGVPVPHSDGKAGMATIVPTSDSSGSAPSWLSELESECQRNLPAYARPIFLRVMHSDAKIPTTATFKHLKNVLIEQGFDPAKVNKDDVIYVYDSSSSHYTRMTDDIFKNLQSGNFRI